MWRPELHSLPCRRNVTQTTGTDGRFSFIVREAVPSGTVLEVSLCLEVSVMVVDQLPFLWDFVLTGIMEHGYTSCMQTSTSSRAHTVCVFAEQGEANIGEIAEQVLCFVSSLALFKYPNPQSSKALSSI